jgi:hypothetical protein
MLAAPGLGASRQLVTSLPVGAPAARPQHGRRDVGAAAVKRRTKKTEAVGEDGVVSRDQVWRAPRVLGFSCKGQPVLGRQAWGASSSPRPSGEARLAGATRRSAAARAAGTRRPPPGHGEPSRPAPPPLCPQAQKLKVLHDVIANINMKHGDGALMSLGDKPLAV